jgi:uncharacterized membrane protein SpoIIM required for sporulation
MLEMLLSPRKAERRPWEMFFVGLFYAMLAMLLVNWIFSGDSVLSKYSSILAITFTVIFSMPFMYYLIKNEEEKDLRIEGSWKMLKAHSSALLALMFLFFGFIVAFSLWYMVTGSPDNFQAQIATYCAINRPTNFDSCLSDYGLEKTTGAFISAKEKLIRIFVNNINVLIFTLLLSIVFGAGAIFVLAWNASVIAVAIGIFTKLRVGDMYLGILRYMTHGVFEIGGYFVGALAGGIISIAIIKRDTKNEKFWDVLQDSINLIIVAIILLAVGTLIEVFVTPALF